MARPLPENDLLASTLVEDRSSDFEEMVLRFHEYGDQWLVLGRYGFNRTHLVPLVPDNGTTYINGSWCRYAHEGWL